MSAARNDRRTRDVFAREVMERRIANPYLGRRNNRDARQSGVVNASEDDIPSEVEENSERNHSFIERACLRIWSGG